MYLESIDSVPDVVRENFKIVASIIYLMFMQELHASMRQYERKVDK